MYKGFLSDYGFDTIPLDPIKVDDIHKTGGSILGTSRGGGNRVIDIVDAIERLNINILFIVGGDGTQRGALEIAEEIEKRGAKVSVIGIPKTVDNDLIFIQKYLLDSLDYNFRIEKYLFILLSANNMDKEMFYILIKLLF